MTRSIITITGDDRVHFLQGILTQDVSKLAEQKIQFAALLSPQGKILHDMFLLDAGDAIQLDTETEFAPLLHKRLLMYKLRAKVAITAPTERTAQHTLPDPRGAHAMLPTLGRDFAPDTLTALDACYDLLNAVSFTKGCYVGQEITARMHYKSIARRGWFVLERAGEQPHLANLKFEQVLKGDVDLLSPNSFAPITVDNKEYRAYVPTWAHAKLAQYLAADKNQL